MLAAGVRVLSRPRFGRLGSGRRGIGGTMGASSGFLTSCLGVGFLLGGLLGALAGETHRSACTTRLSTGDRVTALGTVTNRVAAAGRSRVRLRLRDVTLRSDGLRCRVPGLMARAHGGDPAQPGVRVRVTGDWMRFEGAGDWPAPADRQGMLTGVAVRVDRSASPLALELRTRAAERLAARLPPDVAPTALALLLAERDEVEPDLRRRFVEAGLAHLLAISGMHVGLLAAGTIWLLGLVIGARFRMPLALALVAAYVGLIGAPPAARRALVLFAGYTWARCRGWPVRPGELLGLALLAAVVASPGSLLDPGLQLSFAGFAGVVAGGRAAVTAAAGQGRRRRAALVRATAAGAGAVLATTPITAFHFQQTTPVSLLSHFAGGPLVGVALGSLVATLVVPAAVAAPAADVATGALRALHAVADLFARVPGGHRTVAAPSIAMWIAWLLSIEAVRRFVARGRARAAVVPALLAAAALAAGPAAGGTMAGGALLCTLSVGQGDAAVLRTSGGRWLVFDGGPAWGDWNAGSAIVHPFLRRHGARRVELAVLSHPDLDHLGGLLGLLPAIRVERVLDTGDAVPSASYAGFLAEVDAAGVQWIPAAAGDRLRIDDAEITVLGPARSPFGGDGDSGEGPTRAAPGGANATSLSFRLTVAGRFRYLNTGDATMDEEGALLASWPNDSLRADLLKVGHHGSRTSSAAAFLRTVAPSVAVVSAGARNRYGHPHRDVLARLDDSGVERIWRTDRHGTLCVEIDSDGRWRVRGERAWHVPGA